MIIGDNFNDIYVKLINDIIDNGVRSSPRRIETIEKIGQQFILTNPLNCLCTILSRKLNYRFAIIEKMEYLFGNSQSSRLCSYNKNIGSFVNELTGEFDGAYGTRIGRQLRYVYELLRRDPSTRQAVININNESDKHETKDVPCTISLQFILRDEKLHLIATMRSNDLLWGTPYDVNGFCFLQEAMSSALDVKLGNYIHQAGSLHIYTDRIPQLTTVIRDNTKNDEQNFPITGSFDEIQKDCWRFFACEYDLRNKRELDKKMFNSMSMPFQEYFARL